jgi:RNA polymerase sigma factor for flagellar operon FliA
VDRQQLEATFLAQLPAIEQIARSLCRRYGLDREESDDFVGLTRLKLVEDDYAVLRKFRGESSITTYLAVVIAMLMRERHVRTAGRWRPSAEARRQGAWAVRLETLVYRNGWTLREAAETLRSAQLTTLSDRELSAALAKLPRRMPLRPLVAATESSNAAAAGVERADAPLLDETKLGEQEAAQTTLEGALDQLSAEDRVVVRLLFWNGLSVADCARALSIPQKPLYRHVGRLLQLLRAKLEAAGITTEHVRSLIDDGDE